jgi:hypothetical protein
LRPQLNKGEDVRIIVTDFYADKPEIGGRTGVKFKLNDLGIKWIWTEPKPTVWQGKHRVTSQDWWAMSSARSTAVCLCETDYIMFLDDRCVLFPGWMEPVRQAIKERYIVAGAYEKRTGMIVTDGVITHGGIVIGKDSREEYVDKFWKKPEPFKAPGEWTFGACLGAPLEWVLNINSWDETCDGCSMEDCIFGLMMQNNGYPIMYDKRIKIVEDRTPSELGYVMKREDKGVSPNDKTHALLAKLRGLKRAAHPFDIRQLRSDILGGKPWPIPTWPTHDWYDGTEIKGI